MSTVKILIQDINLDSISFILEPNTVITKNSLEIFCNDIIFSDYDLIAVNNGSNTLYKIVPYVNFSLQDTLLFKIYTEDIKSTTVKVIFLTQLQNGSTLVPFKITNATEGKYIFTLNKYNSVNTNINSYPLMAIQPIDTEKSTAWIETPSPSYPYGEIITIYFKLIMENNKPVPDGFYEITISQ